MTNPFRVFLLIINIIFLSVTILPNHGYAEGIYYHNLGFKIYIPKGFHKEVYNNYIKLYSDTEDRNDVFFAVIINDVEKTNNTLLVDRVLDETITSSMKALKEFEFNSFKRGEYDQNGVRGSMAILKLDKGMLFFKKTYYLYIYVFPIGSKVAIVEYLNLSTLNEKYFDQFEMVRKSISKLRNTPW